MDELVVTIILLLSTNDAQFGATRAFRPSANVLRTRCNLPIPATQCQITKGTAQLLMRSGEKIYLYSRLLLGRKC
jgi:hypothetical protein